MRLLLKHFQFAHLEQILCVEYSWFLDTDSFSKYEYTFFPQLTFSCQHVIQLFFKVLSEYGPLTGNGLLAHSYKSEMKSDNLIFKL